MDIETESYVLRFGGELFQAQLQSLLRNMEHQVQLLIREELRYAKEFGQAGEDQLRSLRQELLRSYREELELLNSPQWRVLFERLESRKEDPTEL